MMCSAHFVSNFIEVFLIFKASFVTAPFDKISQSVLFRKAKV